MRKATVLGFAPWWSLNTLGVPDIAGDDEVAYFGLDMNRDGTVAATGPGASGIASPAFARLASAVHAQGSRLLLSAEALAPGAAAAVISDPAAPARLVASLTPILAGTGAQGVNLDLEGLGQSDRGALTGFVSATAAGLRQAVPSIRVVVDVTADAGSPSSAYDAGALAAVADQIFVMAYDMSGASWAGPDNALPSEQADVARITAAAPSAKVILGVPLYARTWVTTSDAPRAPAQPSAVAVQAPAQPAACPAGAQTSGSSSSGAPPSSGQTSGSQPSPGGTTSTSAASSSSSGAGSGPAPNASASGGAPGQPGGSGSSAPQTPGPQAPAPAQAIPYGALATRQLPLWWDSQAFEAWAAWLESGHWHEAYFDTPVAMQARGALAARLGLGGVGLWALGMDDQAHDLAQALLRGFSDATAPAPPGLSAGPRSVTDSSPPPTILIPPSNQPVCQPTTSSSTSTSSTSTTSSTRPSTTSSTSTTSTTQPTTSTASVPSSSTTSTTTAR